MVHFCDGLFGLISMAGAGPSVLKFESGGAGAGLGWSYGTVLKFEYGGPGAGLAGAELGFGLNGLHIECCLVCLAFMV